MSFKVFDFKNSKVTLNDLKKSKVINSLPFVTLPLVAYMQSATSRNNLTANLVKDAVNKMSQNKMSTPVTDRTEINLEALKKAGVSKTERMKYIKSNGYIDDEGKEICKSKNITSFKASPDDIEADYIKVDEDYLVDSSQECAEELLNDDIPSMDDLVGLDDIHDVIEKIPVAGAVVAEALPGTRFFKPIKDLCNGDIEKAAVGTLSRTADIVLSPLKLGYVGLMGICSSFYKLCGIDEDYTGFINGVKLASKNWAEARDEIEDTILGRETKFERERRLQEENNSKKQ